MNRYWASVISQHANRVLPASSRAHRVLPARPDGRPGTPLDALSARAWNSASVFVAQSRPNWRAGGPRRRVPPAQKSVAGCPSVSNVAAPRGSAQPRGHASPNHMHLFTASPATRCRLRSQGALYFRRERAGSYPAIRTSRVRRTR
jgi:hypothetical protein